MIVKSLNDISRLPQPALGFLPAIHDATLTEAATLRTTPGADSGQVYQNTAGAVTLPSYANWPAQPIANNALYASDGRFYYPVFNLAETNSYYPQAFERTLYTFGFTAESLPVAQGLLLTLDFFFRLIQNNTTAVWNVVWEIGMRNAQSTPSPVGPNLQGFTWRDPIINQQVLLTDLETKHTMGVALRRDLDGEDEVWSGNRTLYGKTLGLTEDQLPTANDFVLRIRLSLFDIENGIADPRGYVRYFATNKKE